MVRSTSLGLVVAALMALGCGGPKSSTLSGSFGKPKDAHGSDTSAEPAGTSKLSRSVTAPSVGLGCGKPCGEAAVDEAGRCADDVAVRCEAGIVVCDDCPAGGAACSTEGHPASCVRGCEDQQVCTGDGCFDRVCCPNAAWCDRGVLSRCDETGRFVETTPCQLGLDCYSGQCLPAQPYVMVLFDTSDSMNWTATDGSPDPAKIVYPACDDKGSPETRVGLSKVAFSKLFSDPRYDRVAFALMRFPQRLDPSSVPRCMGGAYLPANLVTGHEGVYTTGAWFGENLDEVLVVPFPNAGTLGNRPTLSRWLDFDEVIRVTETPCTSHSDCPGGLCTQPGGQGLCRYFDNPELRAALSATPLGTTLFYAGQYYADYVVREGQPCVIDRDCLTPTQFCVDTPVGDGSDKTERRCHDPNRFCRQRSIVAFTDGVDTASVEAFYQPDVQARRLRGGLDCTMAADCNRGFICDAASGTCQRDGTGCGVDMSCLPSTSAFPRATQFKSNRVFDKNGDPIVLTVHVVDVSGPMNPLNSANVAIAAYGGGIVVKPALADPATLYEGIRGVIDWKDADFCADQ